MPVNWKDPKAFERLIAATIAAHDLKLDYRKIATMFGQGATYDSVEGRFRIFRKEAAKLQQEIANGDRPAAPRRGGASTITTPGSSFADDEGSTPKKPKTTKPRSTASTPRANKKGDGKVLAGRVVKTTNPVKKEKAVKVEDEEDGMEVDADSVAEGLGLLDGVFGFGNEGELEV